uniref:Ring finger protein, putative n=1 Tax=Arundo donax TaxID=35708 RepID=A0A0A9DXM4_ARUDO
MKMMDCGPSRSMCIVKYQMVSVYLQNYIRVLMMTRRQSVLPHVQCPALGSNLTDMSYASILP